MTDRYAVIGNPVAHSKSPQIHAAFARQTGQDMEYGQVLAPLDDFRGAVARFRAAQGRGLNVTLPFKEQALALATVQSDRARAALAVNTLRFDSETVFGDNTDGAGLIQDLRGNLGFAMTGKRVLLLGAGGAARGAIAPLRAEGPASLIIANRTLERALVLERQYGPPLRASSYETLAGKQFDIVINATSASLAGSIPPLPAGVFAGGSLAYDMMYGEGRTPFLEHAARTGAGRAADGLGMLVEQAAESFLVWRGVRPQTAPVLAALRAG